MSIQIKKPYLTISPVGQMIRLIALILVISLARVTTAASAAPTPILTLDQIRPGMTGYGLSVFHGTKIEPFDVEVVSVMHDFGPKRGVVWIRCPDERMQKLGPVQGMSGSPIYLWTDEDQVRKPGSGGRLIGAFAFGYGATKDCYVGVQPITFMREAGSRATSNTPGSNQPTPQARGLSQSDLQTLLTTARRQGSRHHNLWRSAALMRLYEQNSQSLDNPSRTVTTAPTPFNTAATRLALPLNIPWPDVAEALSPLLQSQGFAANVAPLTTASSMAGNPPKDYDVQAVRFAPGGVLSIPLGFGDMDITAVGTVTEVLPDGTVLGFGHSMFSQGPSALPMATGYVHMVMPSLMSSFKLGGSGVIRGAIVQDENSAVVGIREPRYKTAPVNIRVDMPPQPSAKYNYQVVQHRAMAPLITAMTAVQSIGAVSDLPPMSTLRFRGKFDFDNGDSLSMDSLMVDATRLDVLIQVVLLLAVLQDNPHEPLNIQSADMSFDVESTRRAATIMHAQLRQARIEPGNTADIDVHLRPYNAPPFRAKLKLRIPQHLRDGEYQLMVCDANTYVQLLFDSHPHLLRTANTHDMIALLNRIMSVKDDALYAILQLPEPSLALGRQELPQLPSSRRALISSAASTLTSNYQQWVETVTPINLVPQGSAHFTLTVQSDLTTNGSY